MAFHRTSIRLQKDLANFKGCDASIAVHVHEGQMTDLRVYVLGPDGSPHADAALFFTVSIPSGFPLDAPKFAVVTTGGGKVRLHPNLYANGKVCVTALGTWTSSDKAANGWSPATQLSSVAIAIQSLLIPDPYHGEPGFEACAAPKSAAGWKAGDSMASPAAIEAFLAQAGGKGCKCCGYAVKVRFHALRLGVLYPLLAVAAAASGPQACDVLLGQCTVPGAHGVRSCADILTQTMGQGIEAAGGSGADIAHDESIIASFARFVRRHHSRQRVEGIADECDSIHAALVAAGSPRGGDGSNIKKFYEFESPSNGAPHELSFDALAADLRLLAATVCLASSPEPTPVRASARKPESPTKRNRPESVRAGGAPSSCPQAATNVIDVDDMTSEDEADL